MILSIGICGAIGASLRFFFSQTLIKQHIDSFPKATFVINLLGSFLLGVCYGLHSNQLMTNLYWNLIGVGFLGAFTTFSTFSYEGLTLLKNKKMFLFSCYVIGSIVFGVALGMVGIKAVNVFFT